MVCARIWRSLKFAYLVAKLLPIRAGSYATHLPAVTAEIGEISPHRPLSPEKAKWKAQACDIACGC